jgi:hypothetical protein
MVTPKSGEQLDAVHVVQHDVAEDKVERGARREDRERVLARTRGNDIVFDEGPCKNPPFEGLVVDDEDSASAKPGSTIDFSYSSVHEETSLGPRKGGAVENRTPLEAMP